MMEALTWFGEKLLDNAFGAGFGGLLAWLWARRQIRDLRRMVRHFEESRGSREVVLLLSVRNEIEEAVRSQLPESLREAVVFSVHSERGFSEKQSDWLSYVRRIRDEVYKIRRYGASRIHLFMNTPVALAVFAGALLDNGPEVVVHHYFNGVYGKIGSLTHETVNA